MNIPIVQDNQWIILANGEFPSHPIPISFLYSAEKIICCDGAVENLLSYSLSPNYIIGDMDSISISTKRNFSNLLVTHSSQKTNDLTKALQFCCDHKWEKITIIGATGKREDHMIGNIALITKFSQKLKIQILTDYGVFVPQQKTTTFESFPKQQISIFNLTTEVILSSSCLLYPLKNKKLKHLWEGTLNEATKYQFTIKVDCSNLQKKEAKLIIFREYFSIK